MIMASNNPFSVQADKSRNFFCFIFRLSLRFRKLFCYSLHSLCAIKINNIDVRLLGAKKEHREIGEEWKQCLKSVFILVKLRNFSKID